MPKDTVLGNEPRVFAADVGHSLTSHGDGTPVIDEGLVNAREKTIKDEEQKQQKLRDDAKKLLGSSGGGSSASSSKSSAKK